MQSQQDQCLNALREWWHDDKPGPFIIDGAAGSGKTFLAAQFLKCVSTENNLNIYCLGPTNKAHNVLADAVRNQNVASITRQASLHQFFNLEVDKKHISRLHQTKEPFVFELRTDGKTSASFGCVQTIIVVDEISMVPPKSALKIMNYTRNISDLAAQLNAWKLEKGELPAAVSKIVGNRKLERCYQTFKVKFLFLGDKYQLYPVNETQESQLFSVKPSTRYKLDEIVRTTNDAMKKVYNMFRRNVIEPQGHSVDAWLAMLKDLNIISILSDAEVIELCAADPNADRQILVSTNERREYFNRKIQLKVHERLRKSGNYFCYNIKNSSLREEMRRPFVCLQEGDRIEFLHSCKCVSNKPHNWGKYACNGSVAIVTGSPRLTIDKNNVLCYIHPLVFDDGRTFYLRQFADSIDRESAEQLLKLTTKKASNWRTSSHKMLYYKFLQTKNHNVDSFMQFLAENTGIQSTLNELDTLINDPLFAELKKGVKIFKDFLCSPTLTKYWNLMWQQRGHQLKDHLRQCDSSIAHTVCASDTLIYEFYCFLINTRIKWLNNYLPVVNLCYATTCHRAQGSTYNKTIVDFRNIAASTWCEGLETLMYVAMTRARNKIILIA